ncbi:trypsin-like peptidase domain-containing protein [Longibacter salinarum]|nr:trypsin-like peptidase domain-containing protein [Longibacter salinarum]
MKRFTLFLAVALFSVMSVAAQSVQPPSERLFTDPLDEQNVSTVQLTGMPSSNVELAQSQSVDGPLQYGTNRPVDIHPRRNGSWTQLANGDFLWRVQISSPEALTMSAALRGTLPDGAELYVYGADYSTKRKPIQPADLGEELYWTPYVDGSALYIEAVVPQMQRENLEIQISKVVHGFIPLEEALAGRYGKSGACNIDVACSIADPWNDQVDSVMSYTYSDGTGSFVCTGSLVNTTDLNSVPPYVLTAEHCVSTESQANSMVFYFNYQNPTCRTPGGTQSGTVTSDDRNDETMSGATLRMSYGNFESQGTISGKPDVTLVEINNSIPLSYEVFFSGWSVEGNAPAEAVTIHHPRGHGKRISFEYDATSITPYTDSTSGGSHLRIEDWDDGTTEGGSSGSPLYDLNKRVVGVLSGGFASCGNDAPDWYGRISEAWQGGGTPDSRLRDWLDPDGTGATTTDGRRKSLDPDDNIPPSAPTSLAATADPSVGEVTLSWIAPSDDGNGTEPVYTYDIRYATSPITTAGEFNTAARVPFTSNTQAPGTQETTTLSLIPERDYYFAIKAVDDNFNTSTASSTSSATPLPDEIPPARPEDLVTTVADRDAEQVRLTWTAPGDDQKMRTVTEYDVRLSVSPITSEADFEAAERIDGPANPVGPGQTEEVVVDVEPNTPYYFAVRAIDNKGNVSPIGTTEENRAVATSTLVLTEPSSSRVTESVSFRVATTEQQTVDVAIYDVLGRRVFVVFNEEIDADQGRAVMNLDLSQLSSGRYFIRALGQTGAATQPISIVR